MISFDAKPETSSGSSPISLVTQEEEPSLSFSDLLKGVVTKKDDTKVLKEGSLVLAFDEDTTTKTPQTKLSKNDVLLSLLQGETTELSDEPLELNPKLTQTLTSDELKSLVQDAKKYLKDKIVSSDEYKRSEIKELPKTLKGLAQVAKKYDIDVSKITLQEVQVDSDISTNIPTKEVSLKQENKATSQEVVDITEQDTLEVKLQKPKKELQNTSKTVDDVKVQEDTKNINQKVDTTKELKSTPLFKAQTQTQAEHSTEQIVQTKMQSVEQKTEQKTPKQKADETLQLLLRGEKASKSESGLSADFSVATAKVIAPSATTQAGKNLESLLHGETKDDNPTLAKTDGLNVNKADSFEVKLNEAKQMTKYLSQDVKTAIDDYKSPFTRVKVQLNPQRLGEVDLTIVQRGKNLHINLSSNNAAINALAMNANDLKVQLNNNGIQNASLNFNNSSQSGEQAASQQQQQHHHREQEASEEYNYFTSQEENEEILSSLEIVVPHYA
jgi:flagellar hook-length control protein FliK